MVFEILNVCFSKSVSQTEIKKSIAELAFKASNTGSTDTEITALPDIIEYRNTKIDIKTNTVFILAKFRISVLKRALSNVVQWITIKFQRNLKNLVYN